MPIKVYTKPGCPGCRLAKDILDEYEIKYTTVDVSVDSEARDYLINDLGAKSVPVIEDQFGAIVNPEPAVIRELAEFYYEFDHSLDFDLIHDYVWEGE